MLKKKISRNTKAFVRAIPAHERSAKQRKIYEQICAEQIKAIPQNIKNYCVGCGAALKMTTKRYEERGNFCLPCDRKMNHTLRLMGILPWWKK